MKTITGKVYEVEIGAQIKKRAGGTYEGWRLTYKTPDGELQKVEKPVANFKYQPSLKTALEGLSKDDEFTMEMEKDGDFWNVTSIAKGVSMPAQTGKADNKPTSYKTDKSGNWETSEERAARQVMIVRQSSLSTAVALLGPGNTTAAVIKTAKAFEDYVMGKEAAKAEKRVASEPEVE